MKKDNLIESKNPESFVYEPITDVLRLKARRLFTEVLEIELGDFLSHYRDLKDSINRQRVFRNGYLPERDIRVIMDVVYKCHLLYLHNLSKTSSTSRIPLLVDDNQIDINPDSYSCIMQLFQININADSGKHDAVFKRLRKR